MKKTGMVTGILFLICGIVPVFYGVRNTGTAALLFAGLFILFLTLRWRRLPRVFRVISAVCVCVAFAISVAVSVLMARQAWFRQPPADSNLPVVVLGGRVYEHGPSLILSYRLNTAAEYLQDHPQAVCVVSGGQGADEPSPEAEVMAQYLISKHNIDPGRIILEAESTNTSENIRYSNALLEESGAIVIATDSFHQLRASMLANAEGITAYSISSFTPPGLFPAYWTRDLLGVLYVWVTRNTI